jgi:hypothetical protein
MNVKIFVTWSGAKSRGIGDLLQKYLPFMVPGVDVFMSMHDIGSGERWTEKLAEELKNRDFGLLCLTRGNLTNPWVLFEAGALTKQARGRACALLVGDLSPAGITGPLSQFQHRRFIKTDFRLLVRDLNRLAEQPFSDAQQDSVFQKWWPDIEKEYKDILSRDEREEDKGPRRDRDEIIEEILVKVRSLERAAEVRYRTPTLFEDASRAITVYLGTGDPPLYVFYDQGFLVQELLDMIYTQLEGRVRPYTFGEEWALVDVASGRRLIELEASRTAGDRNMDKRVFSDVGLRPGSALSVLYLPLGSS